MLEDILINMWNQAHKSVSRPSCLWFSRVPYKLYKSQLYWIQVNKRVIGVGNLVNECSLFHKLHAKTDLVSICH